jgi:hypothetical protein
MAFIEEDDRCVPLFDLVIPNDLDDAGLVRYGSDRFAAFARSGTHIAILDDDAQGRRVERHTTRSSNRLSRDGGLHTLRPPGCSIERSVPATRTRRD